MWQQVETISRSGRRYKNRWLNTSTGETLSNRKYQQRFGSVAKAGFTTIERKTAASLTAKGTTVRRELFKFSKTEHTTYTLDINGLWQQQIEDIISERKNWFGFFARFEIYIRGKEHTVFVGTHVTDDLDMLFDWISELFEVYEFDGIKNGWLTTIGETN